MAKLALDLQGHPIDFSPLDYETAGGNMVLWDKAKGGRNPWDRKYFQEHPEPPFDPEYITRHAPDSAATATSLASGHKTSSFMLSTDLYENPVTTIVEEAMRSGKAAGVVTSGKPTNYSLKLRDVISRYNVHH